MTTTVQVMRATEADAAETLALLEQLSQETDFLSFTPATMKLTLSEQVAYLRSQNAPDSGIHLKAVVDGVIAGTAGITRPKSLRFRHAGEIGIGVLRRYWGQGVGRALMEAIVREGKALGFRRLSLKVRADNTRAVALYESLGFRHEGRLVGAFAVGDVLYDDLQMGMLFDSPKPAP